VVEKRSHPRASIDVEVVCRRADGTSFNARGSDISMGGMYVAAPDAVVFGEALTLELKLPAVRAPLSLPALVRWTNPGGFGVQFGLLGARETHTISSLVRR
jgi:Tfp pilus assembly protein PilZ